MRSRNSMPHRSGSLGAPTRRRATIWRTRRAASESWSHLRKQLSPPWQSSVAHAHSHNTNLSSLRPATPRKSDHQQQQAVWAAGPARLPSASAGTGHSQRGTRPLPVRTSNSSDAMGRNDSVSRAMDMNHVEEVRDAQRVYLRLLPRGAPGRHKGQPAQTTQ